jgi:peptide/nickel transport system permease protein
MSIGFLPVPLPTDVLLWLLGAVLAGYFATCRRRPHLAAPWLRVLKSRAAIVSLVLLSGYAAIGLADSLHFRLALARGAVGEANAYSPEVLSLLDLLLAHLRHSTEKTYSAPLATRLFVREEIELPDGRVTRSYPRLSFGGALLANEADEGADIARRVLRGLAGAALAWAVIGFALRPARRRWPEVPWTAGFITLGVMLALLAPAWSSARSPRSSCFRSAPCSASPPATSRAGWMT